MLVENSPLEHTGHTVMYAAAHLSIVPPLTVATWDVVIYMTLTVATWDVVIYMAHDSDDGLGPRIHSVSSYSHICMLLLSRS